MLLRDGDALELDRPEARFTIPWMPQFETGGDYEGIAMTFDFFPFDSLPPGQTLPLVRMGAAVTLNVVEARGNALRLGLTSSGVSVETDTWIALNRWATVELAVSAYGVTLYVDGRLSAAKLPPDFRPASARDANIEIGGVACRIDNFDVMGLVAGQVLELEGTHLIARGVDPMLEVTMQAEAIYDIEAASGPVTGPDAAPSAPVAGLPRVPPPGLVHVYFDGSGKLDPARHPGAVEVHMISGEPGEMKRVKLTFHPLGMVTSDVVEAFDWEQDAVGTGGMNGNSK
jgi:hypothetical protein